MCLREISAPRAGVSIAAASILFSGCFCPPNPKANVERSYGSPIGEETAIAIRETADGGFILAGYQNFYNDRGQDIYLVKTDANFEVVWERTLNGPMEEVATAVRQLPDGGYIVSGARYSYENYMVSEAMLVRVRADGATLWSKTYGGDGEEEANDVVALDDGGFAFAGATSSTGFGYLDMYLVRTDADGNELWSRTFGGLFEDRARGLVATDDGGFIVAGSRYIGDDDRDEIYIVKTDANGETVWTRAIAEGTFGYRPSAITAKPTGGYAVAGFGFDYGPGAFVLHLDEDGQNPDTKFSLFGEVDGYTEFNSIAALPNGDVIAAGATGIFCVSFYLARVNPSGGLVWERKFGGGEIDFGLGAIVTSDNKIVVVGGTGDFEGGDAYLIQTGLNGN